jgi:hypothetical protein
MKAIMIYWSSIFMILACLITAPLALAQISVPTIEQAEKLLSEGDAHTHQAKHNKPPPEVVVDRWLSGFFASLVLQISGE